MMRGVHWFLVAPLVCAAALAGCRFGDDGREAWRAEAEEQCLAEKGVVPSAYMEPLSAIYADRGCGMEYPFRVSAFAEGNVMVEPAARLGCPVTRELDGWVQQVVQPAAQAWLGQQVVAIRQMSSYSCRNMNGQVGTKISEHAFGNALDIGAFRVADGRWITVREGWKGRPEERGFLLQVQAGACERFTTVLAPGSNMFHYDHIHVDLMRHAKGRTICKPAPNPSPAPAMAMGQPLPPAPPASHSPPPPPPEPIRAQTAPRPLPAVQSPPPPPPVGNGLPPGWQVGPQGNPGPMSYAPGGGTADVTDSVAQRKYYTAPAPQPSTIPLPQARAGED